MDITKESSYIKAKSNFDEKGPLGVTAEDHAGILGTVPEILAKNPGKTKAELMSPEEIKRYILEGRTLIKNLSKEEQNSFSKNAIENEEKNLRLTINYLKSIGKLPEGIE